MVVKFQCFLNKKALAFSNYRCDSSSRVQFLSKGYIPDEVQCDVSRYWEKCASHPISGYTFTSPNASKYSMLLPPPNVTGTLHLGHALTTTVQDVLAKRRRMEGRDVVWVPGLDHAGIATQAIVEQVLSASGENPKSMSRETFLEQIHSWKTTKSKVIHDQLVALAPSLDWNRHFFTLDQAQNLAVKEAFIRLYKAGLIYRSERLVNWSVKLGSAISDMEVDYKHISGPMEFYPPSFDKPVIFGQMTDVAFKVYGKPDSEIVVSTCRIETMPGDVAVAVHPNDSRYVEYHNNLLMHPITNRLIPVIVDTAVDPNFGTGAVKVTPGHDQADFEMAQRHNLELISVIDESGHLNSKAGDMAGLNRFKARAVISCLLESKGLVKNIREHQMSVPLCSRTGDIIELICKPQWFLKCKEMGSRALESVEEGNLEIIPDQYIKNWISYLENIRDWCISRQVIWGHRIPLYTDGKDNFTLQESDDLSLLDKSLHPVEDVLDTWFSSALLPFSVFGWPHKSTDLKRYFPLDMMITGHDILFFWVARMVMLSLQLTDTIPFKRVLLHSVICDPQGRKMSKSLGNVIDPQHIIHGITQQELLEDVEQRVKSGSLRREEAQRAESNVKQLHPSGIPLCGTDALRLTLLSHKIKNHYIHFETDACYVNKLFFNKLWQACRFTMDWSYKLLPEWNYLINPSFSFNKQPIPRSKLDFWLLANFLDTVTTVNRSIDNYDFHIAVNQIKDFIQHKFCDIYLEAVKPKLRGEDEKSARNTCYILLFSLANVIKLLAPFAPYISEKLHQNLHQNCKDSVHNSEWPCSHHIMIDFPDNMKEIMDEMSLCLSIVKEIRRLKLTYKQAKTDHLRVGVCTTDEVFSQEILNIIETLSRSEFEVLSRNDLGDWSLFSSISQKISVYYLSLQQKPELVIEKSDKLKKLAKLEKELNKFLKMRSHDSYKSKVSESVQKSHSDKISRIEIEIQQLKHLT